MRLLSICFVAISIGLGMLLGSTIPPRPLGSRNAADFNFDSVFGANSLAGHVTPIAKSIGHPALMSPHASPIAVRGEYVYVVNTPADSVDLINSKTHKVEHRIPVGVDPVSISVRPDGKEVWVSNHVSDSVSVIDSDPESPLYLNVVATIQEFDKETRSTRFDEPVGIAFASNEKAYVALSSENQIAVVDVASRKITKRLNIRSQDPRQIVVQGDRLYVIPFESNNKTQLSGGNKESIDGALVTFDAWEHSIVHNNVLSLGHEVDIIKHPEVPDRDLFVFDTRTDKLIESVDTLGTLLYGMTVNSKGQVFIAQTDARNDVNGRAGTKDHGLPELENRAFLNRVTKVDFDLHENVSLGVAAKMAGSGVQPKIEFFDLEPLPPKQPDPKEAMATPFAIVLTGDEESLLVTAAGSDKLVSVDAKSGKILGDIRVGGVPRGIAIESGGDEACRAWVFNAVDNSVSLVDVSDSSALSLLETIELEDPTDPIVKRGRKVFNSAKASTTGTFSCASCHPDGHTDQLLWVLKTPVVTGGKQIMPRSTMPIRGLRETAPFHWDGIPGDPYGGNNSASIHRSVEPNSNVNSPESTARHLVDGAMGSTMAMVNAESETDVKNDEGKAGLLSGEQRDDLAKFLLAVPYPPAQRRSYTNELSERAKEGFELFHIKGDDDPARDAPNVCGDCHRMPNWVSTNTPGTGMDAPTWRGAYDRWLILPQGRLNLVEFPFFKRVAEGGLDERSIWRFSWGGRPRFDPVWNMVLEGSTGFSGTFARQVTLNDATYDDKLTLELLAALEAAAADEAVVVQVAGAIVNDGESSRVSFQFAPDSHGGFYFESTGDNPNRYSSIQLQELAGKGQFVGTFTAHLEANNDYHHPQPVVWTHGPIEKQRGQQEFPFVYPDQNVMTLSGRHIDVDAQIFVDGYRVAGEIKLESSETVKIELAELPKTGMHMLQVKNPNGLFSNDFIFHVAQDHASAEAQQRDIQRARSDKRSALVDAASEGDINEVISLLEGGAQVNARHGEEGGTALSAAALRGDLAMAELLIEKGAKVSRSNRDGNTPLHIAAFLCREDVAKLLLDNGASIASKNGRDESSIDVVDGEWNEGLARFYQAIADGSGFEIEVEAMEAKRKKMARMLREHSRKTKRE